jgi:hypothetical protein
LKCSSNKTIMALIEDCDYLHKRQALPPTARVTDVIACVALFKASHAACGI